MDVYSDIHKPAGTVPRDYIEAARKGARIRVMTAQLILPATLAAGEKGRIGTLPSNAVILPESTLYFSAGLTGLNDVNFGAAADEDALIDGDDWSGGAGNVGMLDNRPFTDYGKRLWELLGYTTDPGLEIELYLTFVAELTGAGTAAADIRYAIN